MNWLRNKVSGESYRFKENGYNLDLTYITDRIIAMSYPASGIEQWFRNKIDKVVDLLEGRHSGHYRVYNLSGREYDIDKFKGSVVSLDWDKHSPPSIFLLFETCQSIYEYLKINKENVVAIHWISGRGRTGALIACFLIFSGLADSAQDAIHYFERIRFGNVLIKIDNQEDNKKDAEIDSHFDKPLSEQNSRAVRYFELIYKGIVKSPSLRILKEVRMRTIPHMSGQTWKPYLEIINICQSNYIYNGK